MRRRDEHRLKGCDWDPAERAWRARCECRWESEPNDYGEDALAEFRKHRLDGLGWRVIRGEGRREW